MSQVTSEMDPMKMARRSLLGWTRVSQPLYHWHLGLDRSLLGRLSCAV